MPAWHAAPGRPVALGQLNVGLNLAAGVADIEWHTPDVPASSTAGGVEPGGTVMARVYYPAASHVSSAQPEPLAASWLPRWWYSGGYGHFLQAPFHLTAALAYPLLGGVKVRF